jgi:hypothetical protein
MAGQREEVPENEPSQPAIGGFACARETRLKTGHWIA